MSSKSSAIYEWFNQLGFMPFYRDTAVPDNAQMPYGTYSYTEGAWESQPSNIVVNLWFRTTSEATPDDAVAEISQAIGLGGALVPCDEGIIWLYRGTPWCQSMTDDADPYIKRRYINITADFLTHY